MAKYIVVCFLCSCSFASLANEPIEDVIEVLAPKRTIALSSSEQSIDYVDEELEIGLNRTVADQLISIAGVELSGQGGQFQSYSIRGFSQGRIRTEINGIPIITDRRAGNSVSFISPDLFSDVAVDKGPASTLFGSPARAGVVNLSTAMDEETVIKLSMQPTSDAYSASIKSKRQGLTSGLALQSAGNDSAPNGADLNTRFQRVSGMLMHESNNGDITTHWSWLPSVGKDIGKSNQKYNQTEISDYPHSRHSLAQVQVSSTLGWSAKLFHHFQDWQSDTERFEQYRTSSDYRAHTLGGQFLQQISLQNVPLYFGVDWLSRKDVSIKSEYQLQDDNNVDALLNNHLQGHEDNVAAFATVSQPFGGAQLTAGLRYDWIKQAASASAYDNQLTASLSIASSVSERVSVYAELANGFRYPTLTERFFNGITPRGWVLGNLELSPEQSVGGELGFKWQIRDTVQFGTNIYRYDIDHFIERYRVDDQTLSYRNVDKAEVSGLELQLQWQLSDHHRHSFGWEQQTGESAQGQTLNGMHPNKFSWHWRYELGNVALVNAVNFYDSVDDVGDTELPRGEMMVWDLSLDYQLSDNQQLRFNINNLTDQSYVANLDEDAPLQPQRSARLTSIWRF